MASTTAEQLTKIRVRHRPAPRIFVETGTYQGKTTRFAIPQFRVVHTIELADYWFQQAMRTLAPQGAICHHGDSATLVRTLSHELQAPAFWYLDAHWSGKLSGAEGYERGLPLWAELEAIAERAYADVVVVDDVHSFGTDQPTPEWRAVSLERIAGYFPRHREAVILGDQAAVYTSGKAT